MARDPGRPLSYEEVYEEPEATNDLPLADAGEWDAEPPSECSTDQSSPGSGVGGPAGVECPVAVRVADVQPEHIRWLWPGRIPLGKVTVLDGDPGLGKSTLTLDLAARVSTGSPMPTGERLDAPGAVVLLSAEDGVADTIRPRLEAAGGDLDRVQVFDHVLSPEDIPRPPSIPGDVAHIESLVADVGAVLVVIDPFMAFLGAGVDAHKDQDVRRALHALKNMAERTAAAVLVIRHLSKSGGANPLYRGGGSIGIIGAARAGLLVAVDPDDDVRRILAVSKSNLGPMPPALAYRLVTDEFRDVARLSWEGTTDHTAAALLVPRMDDGEVSARGNAERFLRDLLADGPFPAKRARAEASDAGIARRTLDRAKKAVGVRSAKLGRPGEPGEWAWVLDTEGRQPDPKDAKAEGWRPSGEGGDLREDGDNREPADAQVDEARALRLVVSTFPGLNDSGDPTFDAVTTPSGDCDRCEAITWRRSTVEDAWRHNECEVA